jgi:hypothetical protein
LVAAERVHGDLYTRQAGGHWLLTWVSLLEEFVELQSIGCRIAMADVYEKAELRPAPSTPAL